MLTSGVGTVKESQTPQL